MPGFVIQYHRSTGEMHLSQYPTLVEATRERLRLDRQRMDEDIEIVAVSAEDRTALEHSHSRYFARLAATA